MHAPADRHRRPARGPHLWPLPAAVLLLIVALPAQALTGSLLKDAGKLIGNRSGSATEKELLRQVTSFTEASIASRNDSIDTAGKVVMYSASWCGYCTRMRNYLRAKNVEFVEFDKDKSARGQVEFAQLGERGVPVTLVGEKKVRGFDPALFERAYAEFLAQPVRGAPAAAAPPAVKPAVAPAAGAAAGLPAGGVLSAKIAGVKLLARPERTAAVLATPAKDEEIVALGEERDGFVHVQGAAGAGWIERLMVQSR